MPRKKTVRVRKHAPNKVEQNRNARKKTAQDLIAERYGSRAYLRPLSEVPTCFDLRRPTGLTSVDVYINGGFCAGGTSVLYGPAGIGKDLLANLCIGEVQRNYGDDARILIVSFGYPHDVRFAHKLGVAIPWSDHDIRAWERENGERLSDEDRAFLKRCVGEVHTVVLGDDEKALENPAAVLAGSVVEAVRAKEYQLIVLNEVGAQLTEDGVTKTPGESAKVGDVSRFFDAFFKWYFAVMNQTSHDTPNETTLLIISQVRSRFGSGFSYLDLVGGNPMRHAATTILELSQGSVLTTSDGTPYAKEILCTVRKGKHGNREGDKMKFTYDFTYGVNYAEDLFRIALSFGVIRREGESAVYDVPDKGHIKGMQKVINALSEDKELYAAVRKGVFKAAGVTTIRYR